MGEADFVLDEGWVTYGPDLCLELKVLPDLRAPVTFLIIADCFLRGGMVAEVVFVAEVVVVVVVVVGVVVAVAG